MLRGRLIVAEWQGWKRDPLTYSGPALNGVFLLFLHRLRPDEDLVDAAVSRLAQVPTVFAQGRANLDPALAHPLIVERALASAKAGARYVRDLLPDRGARVGAVRSGSGGPGRDRGAGVRRLGRVPGGVRCHGPWHLGLRRGALHPDAPGARGAAVRRTGPSRPRSAGARPARRRDVARWRSGSPARATGARSSRPSTQDHPLTEEAMRQAYEVWTARARDFLADPRPGHACPTARSAWSSRRPSSSARCSGSPRTWHRPAFSDSVTGHFFVPFAPDGTSADEVDKRLSSNSHGGHPDRLGPRGVSRPPLAPRDASDPRHRSCVGCSRPPTSRRAGRCTRSASCASRASSRSPSQELQHLEANIFRAARIVVDTSLHTGRDDRRRGRSSSCSGGWPWPSRPPGRRSVDTARGRRRRRPTSPAASRSCASGRAGSTPAAWAMSPPSAVSPAVLREFHDTITSSGALPLGLAERVMLDA